MDFGTRSASGSQLDFANSDDETTMEAPAGGSVRKGKETVKDIDARKEQNRIAQREFRLRKQQYIKELELKVEIFESNRDVQLDRLTTGIKALISENQQLRGLLASMAGFIGTGSGGIGGVLSSLGGIDLPEFDALISRLENDHITDALKERPGASATPGRPPTAGPSTSKRQKAAAAASSNLQMDTSVDFPAATTYSPPTYRLPAQQTSRPPSQTTSPTVNLLSSSTDMSTGMATSESDKADALTSSLAKACSVVEGEVLGDIRSRMQAGMIHGSLQHIQAHEDNVQNLFSRPTDNPKLQAIQLISYHMRNKRENPSYHLPPSLCATVTQQTVPHNPFFDGIIFSSLRDRLILLLDQYDLQTLLVDLVDAMAIHEDDILQPSNWELSAQFIRKYWYVIDAEVLAITNRWRRERGDSELSMREIVPDGADVLSEGLLGKK